jgi:uncharacterized damage-inducible protein DinB
MTASTIRELFDFDAWATAKTLDSVAPVEPATYLRDLKSSHGGIHGTLVHVFGASTAWLRRWKGVSPSALTPAAEVPDLPALKGRWAAFRAELTEFLAGLDDEALQDVQPYTDLRGNPHAEPLGQQMLHVINHSSYHRGQVVTMMRQVGAAPVATDLIAYYRERAKSR